MIRGNNYNTKEKKIHFHRYLHIPSEFIFYSHLLWLIIKTAIRAKYGDFSREYWIRASHKVIDIIEASRGRIHIRGLENIQNTPGPVVFIGNHMSILETFVLPCLILPRKNVTFILKDSLLTYPILGQIIRVIKPIAVTRTNPRHDLKLVITKGLSVLKQGRSIIIFPQRTRTNQILEKEFNSLGIKLAQKAGVPVIPIALKTDFCSNGKWIKDVGRIGLSTQDVYFSFGEALYIEGKGKEEHKQVIEFIKRNCERWS